MKIITKEWLQEVDACPLAVTAGLKHFGEKASYDTAKVIDWLEKEKKFGWGCWLLPRLMTHTQQVQFAIFAAELVIDIFEKQYPDDKLLPVRPRQAIDAAKEFLKNPTEENRSSARYATSASFAAGYASSDAILRQCFQFGRKLLGGRK